MSREVIMLMLTSYMKKVGVQMRASSPSSRKAQAMQMDGFVDAVGEDELVAAKAQVGGDEALDGSRARGRRSGLRPVSSRSFPEHARAGREGVLVEVETAQGFAAGERWGGTPAWRARGGGVAGGFAAGVGSESVSGVGFVSATGVIVPSGAKAPFNSGGEMSGLRP